MAKKPAGKTGLIQIRLGSCLTMNTKAATRWLDDIALRCKDARHQCIRSWEQWRLQHPEYIPEKPREFLPSMDQESGNGQVSPSTWLYHRAKEGAGASDLNSQILSCIAGEINDHLRSRALPLKDFPRREMFTSEAILRGDKSRMCPRAVEIPLLNKTTVLWYRGEMSNPVSQKRRPVKPSTGDPWDAGNHCACVMLNLWSASSGHSQTSLWFRIEVRQLSRGNRQLVADIAAGRVKLCDSSLVRKGAHWFMHVVYRAPVNHSRLNPNRTLHIVPGSRSPFRVVVRDELDDIVKEFNLGNGEAYLTEQKRLELRRKMVRWRWRSGAKKGRGREHFQKNLKAMERRGLFNQADFRRGIISRVVAESKRYDAGTVVFHMPTDGMKASRDIWFGANKITIDWNRLSNDLSNKIADIACFGVPLRLKSGGDSKDKRVAPKITLKQWREQYGPKKQPNTAVSSVQVRGKRQSQAVS